MIRNGGYNSDRWEHGYFDVESVSIPCSAMLLNDALYDALTGGGTAAVEYFADVFFGPSLTQLPNIEKINLFRSIENPIGSCTINFLSNDAVTGLVRGAQIKVRAGVRIGAIVASQQVFSGFIDSVENPVYGVFRGEIRAFDGGKVLSDAPCLATSNSGLVPPWVTAACDALALGPDFFVDFRCPDMGITDTTFEFSSLYDAVKAQISAITQHFFFFNNLGNLIVIDPAMLFAETPLFTVTDKSFFSMKKISDRKVNQIDFQGRTWTSSRTVVTPNTVTYSVFYETRYPPPTLEYVGGSGTWLGVEKWVQGTPFAAYYKRHNSTGTTTEITQPEYEAILAENAELIANPDVEVIWDTFEISGTWNDTTDQSDNGIVAGPSVTNLFPYSIEGMTTFVESVADELNRDTWSCEMPFNPFVDLGAVISHDGVKKFVASMDCTLEAGNYQKLAKADRSPSNMTVELRSC